MEDKRGRLVKLKGFEKWSYSCNNDGVNCQTVTSYAICNTELVAVKTVIMDLL